MALWVGGNRWVLVLLVLLGGCAVQGYRGLPAPDAVGAQACQSTLQDWQHQVMDSGAFEAKTTPVPGFPYLRVNRFLASFDLNRLNLAQRSEWLAVAWENARHAWHLEAANLGKPESDLAPLVTCAEAGLATLRVDRTAFLAMASSVDVPDDYVTWQRAIGLYPLLIPYVKYRTDNLFDELLTALDHYQPQFPQVVYQPNLESQYSDGQLAAVMEAARQRSALAIPRFNSDERARLFATFAPVWLVERRGEDDKIGVPARGEDGLVFEAQPVVYRILSYTRWGSLTLPQLTYLIWFPRRTASGPRDILAGELDGLIWRVTLNELGKPMLYDSIHPCGCFHLWFPVRGQLNPRPLDEISGERPAIGRSLPHEMRRPELSVAAGTHYLVGIRPWRQGDEHDADHSAFAGQEYEWREYESLLTPSPAGYRLFSPSGLVEGTERPERFLLWPMGVPSAGAMREWGHHATAFLGRRHFDDPNLLNRYFITPEQDAD
ncbi:hypothetical protein [Marinobacter caseinilyticus]|uniref:hypothetical protein n=1 Tax=Marinobacter caseinilyticus TaxID=2692195 RepID=UPI00140871C2|nr:hypothetical protein [Marinobacter caseinilyticus]